MFVVSEKSFIDPLKCPILQIYQSINESKISPGDSRAPEFAIAGFLLVEEDEEKLKLYVGIYFRESSERILYESAAFKPEESAEILVQAEAFVGGMGFMMDDLRYGIASDEEREDMVSGNPFLSAALDHSTEKMRRRDDFNRTSEIALSSLDQASRKNFVEAYTRLLSML